MKTLRKIVAWGLTVGLVTATTRATWAQSAASPATPLGQSPSGSAPPHAPRLTELQISGRIVAVDKPSRTVSLRVDTQVYVFRVDSETKFNVAGKPRSLGDLASHQDVRVTVAMRESPTGEVDLAVISVTSEGTVAPGSRPRRQGRGWGSERAQIAPFVNLPNPANVSGTSRSPYR